MKLSSVCVLRIYYLNEKEIKMLKLETLFMLVNVLCSLTLLYEYGQRFLKKWAKPYSKIFLAKYLNFRTKIENF